MVPGQIPSHARFVDKGVRGPGFLTSLAELEGVLHHVNTAYENTQHLKRYREIYISVKTLNTLVQLRGMNVKPHYAKLKKNFLEHRMHPRSPKGAIDHRPLSRYSSFSLAAQIILPHVS